MSVSLGKSVRLLSLAYLGVTPSPPIKSLDFRGFDASRLLILRGGILTSVEFDRESPGKFDSRTLYRKTLNRWTGRSFRGTFGFGFG